jgi:DMSO reductase family type II enzyme chaperone
MNDTPMRDEEAVQMAFARSAIYRLLSQCFYRPTPELLEDVAHGPSAPLLKNLLSAFHTDTLEQMLAPERNGFSGQDGSLLESLRNEYDRLFEGPGHVQVPPYESVHRKDVSEMERGLLMGTATLDARRRYAEAGLAIAPDFTDLPDHIAVELEFMCYLCAKEAEAGGWEKDGVFVTAERDFLRDHLKQWLPEWTQKVSDCSRVQFYRDLAKLTLEFVASEMAEMLGSERLND